MANKKNVAIVVLILTIMLIVCVIFLILVRHTKSRIIEPVENTTNNTTTNTIDVSMQETQDVIEQVEIEPTKNIDMQYTSDLERMLGTSVNSLEVLEALDDNYYHIVVNDDIRLVAYYKNDVLCQFLTEDEYFNGATTQYKGISDAASIEANAIDIHEKYSALKSYDWFMDLLTRITVNEAIKKIEIYDDTTNTSIYFIVTMANDSTQVFCSEYSDNHFNMLRQSLIDVNNIGSKQSHKLLLTLNESSDEVMYLNFQTKMMPMPNYLVIDEGE